MESTDFFPELKALIRPRLTSSPSVRHPTPVIPIHTRQITNPEQMKTDGLYLPSLNIIFLTAKAPLPCLVEELQHPSPPAPLV